MDWNDCWSWVKFVKGTQEFLWESEQRIKMVRKMILDTLWKVGKGGRDEEIQIKMV